MTTAEAPGGDGAGILVGAEQGEVKTWDPDARLKDYLKLPVAELGLRLTNTVNVDPWDYADLAAAATLQGESSDAGEKMYQKAQKHIQGVLTDSSDSGYLFDVASEDVRSGHPSLTNLILVSRSAQQRADVRPYRPGAMTRMAQRSKHDYDDAFIEFFRTADGQRHMQSALQEYGRLRYKMKQSTIDANARRQTVPFVFNGDTPYLQVLVQTDIMRRLGWDRHGLDLHQPNLVRDGQIRRLLQLTRDARNCNNGDSWDRMPHWDIGAYEGFLSDRRQLLLGHTAVAAIATRPWRFLETDGSGSRQYSEYLDGREKRIPYTDDTYYDLLSETDPLTLETELDEAIKNGDVERAGLVWTVATLQRADTLHARQRDVTLLVESDLVDSATRLGARKLPRYMLQLIIDNYFAQKYGFSEYPSLLTNDYGSVQDDLSKMRAGLTRWVKNLGGNYGTGRVDQSLLDLTVAYKMYDQEYSRAKDRFNTAAMERAYRMAGKILSLTDLDILRKRQVALNRNTADFYDRLLRRMQGRVQVSPQVYPVQESSNVVRDFGRAWKMLRGNKLPNDKDS